MTGQCRWLRSSSIQVKDEWLNNGWRRRKRKLMSFTCYLTILILQAFYIRDAHTALGDVPPRDVPQLQFLRQPQANVDFSNVTGGRVDCVADGQPRPSLSWILNDGSKVDDSIQSSNSLRRVLFNGSLLFSPFRAEDYRQDIHAAAYRCQITNSVGTIISRVTKVRAVVMQPYEVQVYDEFVIAGNTGVLKCHVPTFISEHVTVTSWFTEIDNAHHSSAPTMVADDSRRGIVRTDEKYVLFPTGELQIRDVRESDRLLVYRCQTTHRLTGETKLSSTKGRLVVTDPKGSVPPRITHSKSTIFVKEGETAILPCAAQGYPVPLFRWMYRTTSGKDDLISTTGRFRQIDGNLVIESVAKTDTGVYECGVNNSVGAERAETLLTITALLSARVHPWVQVVDPGNPASFTCMVSGYPVTSVVWTKDGKTLTSDPSGMQMVYHINSVSKEDKGVYQCFAANDWETVEATGELRLGDSIPTIVEVFAERIVQQGAVVTLRCAISGTPYPDVTWRVDGVNYPSGDPRYRIEQKVNDQDGNVVSTLNISNVATKDGGLYECEAKNKLGQVTSSAILNVYGPPFIRSLPPISIVAGQNLTFRCPVTGYPVDSIIWQKDGKTIPVNHRQIVFNNGTLHIRTVQKNPDAGVYTCMARTKEGQGAQRDFQVKVLTPPKIMPFSLQDSVLHEGIRVQLFCAVTDGDQPVTIEWLKDGHQVPSMLQVTTTNLDKYASSLIIAQLTSQHSGNYTCQASNSAATVTHTAPLNVHVPPRWIVEPRETSVTISQNVLLDCQVDGFPKPIVKWMKAVDDIPGEYRGLDENNGYIFHFDNGSILLRDIRESDEGKYLCQATNGVGAGLSAVIFLDVQVPARFDLDSMNVTAQRTSSTKLRCVATGDQPVEITWSKHGRRLNLISNPRFCVEQTPTTNGMSSELLISEVERGDGGVYSCLTRNHYGRDEIFIYLAVQERPEFPMGVKVTEQNSRSAQMSWLRPFDGNAQIGHYVVQFKRMAGSWNEVSTNVTVPGTETGVILQGLQPATQYQVRVFALNQVGISEPSESVIVNTTEEAPSGPPQDLQIKVLSSQTVQVKWKPPKKDLWNGSIRGYRVGYKMANSNDPYLFKTVENNVATTGGFHSVDINNLKKFTQYDIVVQAFNHVGYSPKSDEVSVKTDEDAPDSAPAQVKCSAQSSQSLHITWEPLSTREINGQLLGYKVIYKAAEEWYGSNVFEAKVTPASKTILHGLQKYTNYSIQVLAYTKAGDSEKSESVFCRTSEDVPDGPGDIKSMVSSHDTVLVTWKEPLHPNGVIVKYTIYMRSTEHGREDTVKHYVNGNRWQFEANNLKKNIRYDFWVTATTAVGEGQSTRVISQTIKSHTVPAKVISFDSEIVVPYKTEVELQCKVVGKPLPEKSWKYESKTLQKSDRFQIDKDGTLKISSAELTDAGIYVCVVNNSYGSDEVKYKLIVQVPPFPPELVVIGTTHTNIDLGWKSSSERDQYNVDNIQGYYLYYKREFGEWDTVQLGPKISRYNLETLDCGTRYQLYMTAFNKIGVGFPSEVVVTKTKGAVPEGPPKFKLVITNTTFISLRLETWSDGGCAILHFVVEYKLNSAATWKLVANNVHPSQSLFIIPDLTPATWYNLRVTAHNSAGSTHVDYEFATNTLTGEPLSPDRPSLAIDDNSATGDESKSLLLNLSLLALIGAALGVVVLLTLLFCLCVRRKRHLGARKPSAADAMSGANNSLSLELKPLQGNKFPTQLAMGSFTHFLRGGSDHLKHRRSNAIQNSITRDVNNELNDDVSPYATSQIMGFKDEHEEKFRPFIRKCDLPSRNHMVDEVTYSKVKKPSIQQHCQRPDSLPINKQDYCVDDMNEDNRFSELNSAEGPDLATTPYSVRPTAPVYVPDLLENGPDSCSSEDTSPDASRRRTYPPYVSACMNGNCVVNRMSGSPPSPSTVVRESTESTAFVLLQTTRPYCDMAPPGCRFLPANNWGQYGNGGGGIMGVGGGSGESELKDFHLNRIHAGVSLLHRYSNNLISPMSHEDDDDFIIPV
ncbi:Down syndrome cell adhesion molecule-like protein 1 [Chamberlinius hualienensis]